MTGAIARDRLKNKRTARQSSPLQTKIYLHNMENNIFDSENTRPSCDSPVTDPSSSDFVIGDYSHLLVKYPSEKGKYICPACQGHNLSIHKDGKKYDCYDCHDTKKIAYELRKLNGEFNGRESVAATAITHYIKSSDGLSSPTSSQGNGAATDGKTKSNGMALAVLRSLELDSKLWFNVRTSRLILGDEELDADTIHLFLADKYGIEITKNLANDACLYFGLQHQVDPVRSYLLGTAKRQPTLELDKLCNLVLGSNEPLHAEYFKRFLIGCVARVLDPGCKFDNALILQGEQNFGKTVVFRVLASKEWYGEGMENIVGRDAIWQLHENWINELGELDQITAKHSDGVMKRNLSRQTDLLRLPYSRTNRRMPRRFVCVGTVNPGQFLKDPTGNRRYWVIPLANKIDDQLVENMRDDIWCSAVHEYLDGRCFGSPQMLPREFWDLQNTENELYFNHHPWMYLLEDWIDTQIEANMYLTINEALDRLKENHDVPIYKNQAESNRVAEIFIYKGLKKKRLTINGKRIWAYVKEW